MATSSRIILGIDPGTQFTGFGVIEDTGSKFNCIHHGVIRAGIKGHLALRLDIIFSGISALIEKYSPADMAIESIFHAKNAQSALKLGHARGVAMLAGARGNLEIHEYTPRAIKKGITGSGAASKAQVQKMMSLLLGGVIDPKPDAADALAVALYHCHHRPWLKKIRQNPNEQLGGLS
jgi:crossover junction endodeoxyribonuclease RuvC